MSPPRRSSSSRTQISIRQWVVAGSRMRRGSPDLDRALASRKPFYAARSPPMRSAGWKRFVASTPSAMAATGTNTWAATNGLRLRGRERLQPWQLQKCLKDEYERIEIERCDGGRDIEPALRARETIGVKRNERKR